MVSCFLYVKSSMKFSANLRFRRWIRDVIAVTSSVFLFYIVYRFLTHWHGKRGYDDVVSWQSRNDKDFYIDFTGVDGNGVMEVFDQMKPYFSKYYCIVPNVIIPDDDNNVDDKITLILHSSVGENLRVIVNHVYNWRGPVSLAIVFPSASVLTTLAICMTDYILSFRNFHIIAQQNLRVHFIFPHLLKESCNPVKFKSFVRTPQNLRPCKMFLSHVDSFQSKKRHVYGLGSNAYPINLARNVARNNSKSSYILIADLEHFFSANFERKMRGFADKTYKVENKTKFLLTYRIFEVAHSAPVPKVKSDLQELYGTGMAQLFHATYTRIHDYPLLDEWFDADSFGDDMTGIQYMLPLDSAALEPQFVSMRNIPMHDENFYYPFRDNTVLRWEACRAGFEFAMVHDVFMFHPGMKTILAKMQFDEVRRKIERKSNWAVDKFAEKMNVLYPETADSCPVLKISS
uniref:Glycosyltransferase family 17 protein n=1 Tax=Panagrellus redivivus TaxID=6233 RepID=A0A7E4W474_PANRE